MHVARAVSIYLSLLERIPAVVRQIMEGGWAIPGDLIDVRINPAYSSIVLVAIRDIETIPGECGLLPTEDDTIGTLIACIGPHREKIEED